MVSVPPQSPARGRRPLVVGIAIVGVLVAVATFLEAHQRELDRIEDEFGRRVSIRHALTREILSRYEDALFGLSTLFMLDGNVTRSEFQRATQRLGERTPGANAFEWVASVPHERRTEFEAAMQRYFSRRTFEITEFAADGHRVRAGERPTYYPISYIEPLAGNEAALGYDVTTAPTRAFLERARATRRFVTTSQFRLVQEKTDQLAVVMIVPVYRPSQPPQPPGPDLFVGFVQGMFRVHDLLELAHTLPPDLTLDMLFVDASEPDAAKRVLYYRPASDQAPRTPVPTVAEFRPELSREYPIPMGGRDWRVLYRPRAGWLDEQLSWQPWMRFGGILLVTGLFAGLMHTVGRRTEEIERQVAERTAELNESRRQLGSMLHALPGMAYRARYDGQLDVIYASEGALALTGFAAEEFIGGRVHFRDLIHPDDLEQVRQATRVALADRRDVEIEYRIRPRDGGEKWVLSRGRGVYADDGRLDLFEGLAIDITERKESEATRLSLERKLLEGQKLEGLGLLAGGVAHDFNNLLTGILGNASLARITLSPGGLADPQLRAIETASLRAAELCRQMLAYAGKGRFVVEPTDLNSLTEGLLPLLEISTARQATLRLALERPLPAVSADPTQLRQIIMNLVINAADAIASLAGQKGGEITVTTGIVAADRATLDTAAAGAGLPAGDYVFIEVRDTGCGMTPEVVAKIFDPFFTTKFAGRGLGLAAALGIVCGHHGALTVTSEPGHGSTFRLLLPPVAAAVPPPPAAGPVSAGRWQHTGKVLLIDDDDAVRTVAAQLLTTFGLRPSSAPDGQAGLALFREDPAGFDVVVLDLLMPGLNGEETLKLLRVIRPDVRVLLISGYHEGDMVARHAAGGPLAFLHKPFTRAALERKLRELLG